MRVLDTGFLRKECQRESDDDAEAAEYDRLYAEIYDRQAADWNIEGGFDGHPFQSDSRAIHAEVVARMAAAKDEP